MKTLFLFFLSFSFITLSSAQKRNEVVIHGTMKGDLKGFNKIYLYTRTSNDSAEIVDGKYTFRFQFADPVMKYLYPQYIREQRMIYQPFGILFAKPGDYYVTSDISQSMQESKVKGNSENLLLSAFEGNYNTASMKVRQELEKMYGKKWWTVNDTSSLYNVIQHSSDSLKEAIVLPVLKNFISSHPDAIASSYVLSMYGRDFGTINQKEELYDLLSLKARNVAQSKDYFDYLSGLKNSKIGTIVQDFQLPDPDGKMVDFKDLKGKYVLVDFWASWCWPCRQSFPIMRKMYKKYSNQPFEIYNISIDEDKGAWLKAVKEEKNPWLQSLDDKNISKKLFAVTAIPATFLIDPQGKIIAKEVGFEPNGDGEIQKKLSEILK